MHITFFVYISCVLDVHCVIVLLCDRSVSFGVEVIVQFVTFCCCCFVVVCVLMSMCVLM